jgi:Flp pilus assembly protein TadD
MTGDHTDGKAAPGGSPRAAFERMLASGKDGALLRYSLGNECLKAGEHDAAVEHLTRATTFDPRYTAAWKLLGKALLAAGRESDALAAWRRGIEVARVRGDKQAEREMGVFVKRLGVRS